MICVYDIGNENYLGNGDAVLLPTECKIRQVHAGPYDLTMTHPIDPMGKWRHLTPEAIIKAPIPEETIESAVSGMDADVYVTTASAALRSGPSEPQRITYSAWSEAVDYSVGSKVTLTGLPHRNYKCIHFDSGDRYRYTPPNSSSWWVQIADYTSGSPVLTTLPSGSSVYQMEAASGNWMKVTTPTGLIGYLKTTQIEYSHHITPSEKEPHIITEQLFRIKSVTVDTKNSTVSVTAEHVSYDLSGVLVAEVKMARQTPAAALAWLQEGFMMPYRGTLATNMATEDDGTVTASYNGKNGIFTILDPDNGIVSMLEAVCRRDNWDIYIMRKTETDRGFRLRYRKNMVSVNWKKRSDSLVTRVVPVAKGAGGEDLYLPEDPDEGKYRWVDSEHIDDYPVVRMERLKVNGQVGKDDGTGTETTWTEETLLEEMEKEAQERFSVDKADELTHEITIDFEQLGSTAEYSALKGLEQAVLNDTVTAIDERIGLEAAVEVIEIEWDAIKKKITALKLSNVSGFKGENVPGYNVRNGSLSGQKFSDDAWDEVKDWVSSSFKPI